MLSLKIVPSDNAENPLSFNTVPSDYVKNPVFKHFPKWLCSEFNAVIKHGPK